MTSPLHLVVVESPAKAKTINKYLGSSYRVLASFGHVRDLPPKDGSVRPDEDFAMSWHVEGKAETRLKDIAKALKDADSLILATDPDREGEAISWHITEELRRRKALDGKDVQRVVFNEITKSAVLEAMAHPRKVDRALVEAYLARRALDYLVGFTLSPVLWRKLPGSRSAGRVQSVALRLICEREAEIEIFKPREFWSVETLMQTADGISYPARLVALDGKKLDKFDLATGAAAEAAVARIRSGEPFRIAAVERKTVRRHPYAPFTTSTLQQEASRKLGFGASQTMRTAQRLYEGVDIGGETVGLITYMRTDGVQMSQEAISAARRMIGDEMGQRYLPAQPRFYKSAAKNAQEAHEAIRPSDMSRKPAQVARYLSSEEAKLYDLIWKRAVASQMASAELDQVAVDIASADGKVGLRANGSVLLFDGFLKLYQEDRDEPTEDDEQNRRLPPLKEGDGTRCAEIKPEQHFTQPPPRYSEASLVKRLEELGIGRPSTYASIIQVLQDRTYVKLEKKRFIPEDRGRVVTAFLTGFFHRYVQYNFTADLENQLDDISAGKVDWKSVLRDFWRDFSVSIAGTKDLTITQVIDELDKALGEHFFPIGADGKDPRVCPGCNEGRLSLKLGKFGAFIGCSRYPDCRYTRRLGIGNGGDGEGGADMGPKALGNDAKTGLPVSLRKGPYGNYVQLGEADPKSKEKPKRVSLPRGLPPAEITLERALALLSLPREVGAHPEDGTMIAAGIGRFGPYIKHQTRYKSLPADDDVLTIGLNRAVALLAEAPGRARVPAGKPVGDHPEGGAITLHSGRYGAYVKHGKLNATLPRDIEPDNVTVEQAVALLAARAEKAGTGKPKRAAKSAAKPKAKAKAKPKAKTKSKAKTTKAVTATAPEESEAS